MARSAPARSVTPVTMGAPAPKPPVPPVPAETADAAEDEAPRTPHSLRWVRAPKQDRSKQTLERLLDAAEEILRTRGPAALTIPAVAQAASSSVGSFYARFPDKAALLRTLHERACAETVATAAVALAPARWEGVPTRELLGGFVAFTVRLFAERRPLMLAFTAELAVDTGFAERRAHAATAVAASLRALLMGRRADLGHPDPERAVDMSLRLVTAVLEQRNGLELGGLPDATNFGGIADETLVAELTRAVLAYLAVRDPRGPGGR